MSTEKEVLKEAALELWNTTKKLRPGLPKNARAQLVLKALITIGDLHDQIEAAMVLGLIDANEPDDEPVEDEPTPDAKETEQDEDRKSPRVVRRRSGS